MFYQIFLSPQGKRWATSTFRHGIYELPQEFPKNLRLMHMEYVYHQYVYMEYGISGICLNCTESYANEQAPCQNEIFAKSRRKLLKNRN